MKLLIAAFVFAMSAGQANANCDPLKTVIAGEFGEAAFSVTIADTNESRAVGLMNVPHMATMSGMLFVYDAPRRATFWMRNTLIGLDMIFAGPDGAILSIHENAIPMDETVIDGGDGVFAVLEVNAGMVDRLGVKTGDYLQHPAFETDTQNSCE